MFSRCNRKAVWPGGVLLLIALLAGTAGIVSALVPARPPLSADVFVNVDLLKALSGLEPDFQFELTREAGFITGPTVLDAALNRPEIAPLEIARSHRGEESVWLARRVRVEFPAPGIVRIALDGERTVEAARLLNSIARAYVDEMINETERLRAERIELVERGQRDVKHRLAEKRDAIGRLEALLAACTPADPEKTIAGQDPIEMWTRELATLRRAVAEGEEMDVRLTAELARLKIKPLGAAVELRRPAGP
jgi:hypothetical protein